MQSPSPCFDSCLSPEPGEQQEGPDPGPTTEQKPLLAPRAPRDQQFSRCFLGKCPVGGNQPQPKARRWREARGPPPPPPDDFCSRSRGQEGKARAQQEEI